PQHPGAFHDVLGPDIPEFLTGVRPQLVRFPGSVPGICCAITGRPSASSPVMVSISAGNCASTGTVIASQKDNRSATSPTGIAPG
ncbi:hypothetical protein, partial [Rhodococcus opacus]|uniref:hypothetical protein n=1 Tax=Rhodococcus opacus TaxID=37919 RepID=UPI0029546309